MSYDHRTPYSSVVTKSKVLISGGIDTMIARAPWANPVNKYFKLRKVRANVTAAGGASGDFVLWDQDLSSATPSKRGSAGAGLYTITTFTSGTSATVTSDLNTTAAIPFYAGLTCRGPVGATINLEVEII